MMDEIDEGKCLCLYSLRYSEEVSLHGDVSPSPKIEFHCCVQPLLVDEFGYGTLRIEYDLGRAIETRSEYCMASN